MCKVSDPDGLTPDRRLVHHVRKRPWLALIPAPCALWQDQPVTCLRRGVWIQHPTWQGPAPGRMVPVLGDRAPGGSSSPLMVQPPAMVASRWPPNGSRPPAQAPAMAPRRTAKEGLGTEIADTRVPQGSPGDPSKGPRRVSHKGTLEAGPAGSAGAGGKPAPGLPRGTRVPVAPPGSPLGTDGAWAKWGIGSGLRDQRQMRRCEPPSLA
jgi:hypothetical protein